MCFYCKGMMKSSSTVFTIQYENNIIVIKNVPCKECSQCGEIEISDETMQKLESIIASAKMIVQEVSVIDYSVAA